MPVSPEDRRRFDRQRAALAAAATEDEGDEHWRDAITATADSERARAGRPALEPWWTGKTEPELHRRARALGLLSRDR